MLGLSDGRGGFDHHRKQKGHAVGDASGDSPVVVGGAHHFPVPVCHGIIGLTAPHGPQGESIPKGNALHRRYGKEGMAQPAFHGIEIGFSQADRQAHCHAFNGAPYGIPVLLGSSDLGGHGLPYRRIQHRQDLSGKGPEGFRIFSQRIEPSVPDPGKRRHMGPDKHALFGQQLLGHCPGKHQRRRQPSGKAAPAPVVVATVEFHISCIIPMARPHDFLHFAVIFGMGVAVGNPGAQGHAGGLSVEEPAFNDKAVTFLPGGGQFAGSRCPAFHFLFNGFPIQFDPGRQPVHHHADGGSVGFPENGQPDLFTHYTAHTVLLLLQSPARIPDRIWPHIPSPPE